MAAIQKRSALEDGASEERAKVARIASSSGASSSRAWSSPTHAVDTFDAVDDDEEFYLDFEMPSDVESVIQNFREKFLAHPPCAGLPPLVLVTQLHAVLIDKTVIDRELDRLRQENKIRMFKLITGADEHAVMLVDDYLHCLKQTASKSSPAAAPNPPKTPAAAPPNTPQTPPAAALNGQSQAAQNLSTAFPGGQSTDFHLRQLDATPGAAPKPTPQERAVQGFIQKLVPVHRELTISHARLIQLLATGKKKASSVNDVEEQVSILLNLGMLARHPADTGSYLFCVPGMGVIVKSILAGRKELLSFIKRKKYKEIAEKQLLKTPQLRSSKLSMEYHLKDLLGRQTVTRLNVPAGPVIKLHI